MQVTEMSEALTLDIYGAHCMRHITGGLRHYYIQTLLKLLTSRTNTVC